MINVSWKSGLHLKCPIMGNSGHLVLGIFFKPNLPSPSSSWVICTQLCTQAIVVILIATSHQSIHAYSNNKRVKSIKSSILLITISKLLSHDNQGVTGSLPQIH